MIAGSDGMLSVELHRRRYLITPPGRRKINLKPEDLITVDLAGHDGQGDEVVDERDWRPHRLVHELSGNAEVKAGSAEPASRATVLADPPGLSALLALQPRAEQITPHGHAALPVVWLDDKILGNTLANQSVVVLPAMGVFASGSTISDALCKLEHAEQAAQVELLLRQAR